MSRWSELVAVPAATAASGGRAGGSTIWSLTCLGMMLAVRGPQPGCWAGTSVWSLASLKQDGCLPKRGWLGRSCTTLGTEASGTAWHPFRPSHMTDPPRSRRANINETYRHEKIITAVCIDISQDSLFPPRRNGVNAALFFFCFWSVRVWLTEVAGKLRQTITESDLP